MNDQNPTDAGPQLPELSQTSIDRIENAVLAQISADRGSSLPAASPAAMKSHARRRHWLTGLGVAAAFVAGVLITPPLLNVATTAGSSTDVTSASSESSGGEAVDMAAPEGATSADGVTTDVTDREIVSSAAAAVRVEDIARGVAAVAALADEHGGYVEGTDISATALSTDHETPAPENEYGWISIRVPAADLTTVIDALGETGTVISSSTSKQDVTSAAIDLRARVDATQASVDRLTELMSQSGSVSELIDAEVALTDRQAQLESYTQQLAALEDQVAMSSLQVQLTKENSVTTAEPDAFSDGLLAGWNGVIVSFNALVIAFGFLLPWLVIAGGVVLVVWLIRRRRRRHAASDIP